MAVVVRVGVLAGVLLAAAPAAAQNEGASSGAATAEPATTSAAAPPPVEKVRGPAEDLVVEASVGYGAGPFTAIHDRRPRVAHGAVFHVAVGWAWSMKYNQSLGVQLFADGMFDGERITDGTTKIGGRYGAAAFVVGEKAHVRVGGGFASSTYLGESYQGLSLGFAAGGHVQLMPENKDSWKRPTVTYDLVPSWDFLNAGSQTLHRWTISAVLGFALY